MTTILPTCVAVDATGFAERPDLAAERPDLPAFRFVFVREDGFAVGACGPFAPSVLQVYEGARWITVLEVDASGRVLRAMQPGEYRRELRHYLDHAAIAAAPGPSRVGDQVALKAGCLSCGWHPHRDPANVTASLIEGLACECRQCLRADKWHIEEAELAAKSKAAQDAGRFDDAKEFDRRRRLALAHAGACLDNCERFKR